MKFLFSLSIIIFSTFNLSGQSTYSNYADSPKTFLGIDYTSAKFVGSVGFPKTSTIPNYIKQWNNFVLSEPSKYDVAKAFNDSKVTIDLSQTQKRNSTIDTNDIVQELAYSFSSKEAEEIALSYSFKGIKGLAILVVAECYNKPALLGSHYVIIVDTDTKEVIYNKKYSFKPKGFGRKNFWAKTYYSLLKELPKDLK